jgi:putative membrane protein
MRDRRDTCRKDYPMTAEPSSQEPDVRFSYANERTFLAWIRTSLGLVTAGLPISIGVAVVGTAAFVVAAFSPS